MSEGRILVHFGSEHVSVHRHQGGTLDLLTKDPLPFAAGLDGEALAERVGEFCVGLTQYAEAVDNKTTRVHATGVFQQLPQAEAAALVNSVYVDTGLYFNIVGPDLERFYWDTAMSASGSDEMVEGMARREFRTAVVCGSFQQSLELIEATIARLRESGTEVLSPRSTRIKPETEGTDFILFDYQDQLKNHRDTWRHKYVHMDAFRQADAVVVCNPGGRVGSGTVFELGFMSALGTRVIFTEEPRGVSVSFPCEVGMGA
ncbi:nucleoside 2-deoxyribosyltransferase (plasmid) [Streptomyces sp. AM 4-1-1]|uniref:nucleoside 2-deoxyribosyltransferase n=1 Tax=Streptomyces sp. AM 4-1-1 TaxID=3028710 RepID=UPI0023B975E9|nr:nucleoside 2-deoxyribosyltransferase [Streptomyces sp. AM 4-1-1]WEH37856.1 nucleoside 2-deoxyribosyltransferase [Streptomyces sp. AM 4-1-1]